MQAHIQQRLYLLGHPLQWTGRGLEPGNDHAKLLSQPTLDAGLCNLKVSHLFSVLSVIFILFEPDSLIFAELFACHPKWNTHAH